jgi:hypothetical protein
MCHIRHMNITSIKRVANQIRGLFSSKLPTGVTEFQSWADSIIDTYDLPTKDRDSVLFALAATLVNLGPTVASKPKYYFVLIIRAGAVKQVAGHFFYEIKQKQKAAQEAAKSLPDAAGTVKAPADVQSVQH